MKIYTSYFSNWRKFPKDAVAISIARKNPVKWKGPWLEALAPSEKLLKAYKRGDVQDWMFREVYKSQLRGLRPEEIIQEIEKLSDGRDAVLCCYERKGEFCHRQLVAEWLEVEEL